MTLTVYYVVALTTEPIEWYQKILTIEFFSLCCCNNYEFKVSQNPIQVSLIFYSGQLQDGNTNHKKVHNFIFVILSAKPAD